MNKGISNFQVDKFFKEEDNEDPLKNFSTIPTEFQWDSTGDMENCWKMTKTNGTSGIPPKFHWNSSSS